MYYTRDMASNENKYRNRITSLNAGMKSVIIAVIFGLCVNQVFAQTRGEGVGALLGRSEGDTTVTVTEGRTAPKSSVFVENQDREVLLEATLDHRGIFTFSLDVERAAVGSLWIYAQDSLGQTTHQPLPGTENIDILLSPTISFDKENSTYYAAALVGYTYPAADVDVVLESGPVGRKELQTTADQQTGRWRLTIYDLAPGTYRATAVARSEGRESVASTPIEVIVELPLLPRVVDTVSKALLVPAVGVALAPVGFSLGDLVYYVTRLLLALRSFFFFRRQKRTQWGVVYDAVTKAPIAGTIVRLYREAGGLVETEVTGSSGAFSFLPITGRYAIRAVKPGFQFPSRIVTGQTDGEYGPIYHGEAFTIKNFDTPFILSIPLDSKVYSMKGFMARIKLWLRQIQPILEVLILVSGLLLAIAACIFVPRWYNIAMIVMYAVLLTIIVYREWSLRATWGIVTDEAGNPVPLVSLSLLETTFQRQVKRRVSDIFGRYQFIATAGEYQLTVTSEQWQLVPTKGAYGGDTIAVAKQTELIIPRVVVRKRG